MLKAQEMELPVDFRQHNLTEYNSSLFSPVFSLDRNQPQSVAFWSRWQWQTVDGDPTTAFFNYSRRINRSMAGGLGGFQQNTGVFLNRGGVLNYAFTTEIAPGLDFSAGLNLFGYQRELADDSFINIPNLPDAEDIDAFMLQVAPGIRLQYGPVSLGVVVEDMFNYNFSTSQNEVADEGNILIGILGFQTPIRILEQYGQSYLQHTIYYKSLPLFDNQFGISTLLSTPRFWAQLGFNNYYGASGGLGFRISDKFSLGALIEYGVQDDFQDKDPTFELVTAFNFGPRWKPESDEVSSVEEMLIDDEEEQRDKELERGNETRIKADSIAMQEKQRRLEREKDSLSAVQKITAEKLADEIRQKQQDSIATAKQEAQEIAAIKRAEEKEKAEQVQTQVTPRKGEKYEEAVNEEGLEAGYYLIANVFRTKRYYEAFMKSLTDRGLNPKSFYRASRKYNYVYLG
ncbi:MAG: PorP/SprF family type IX secretion system membrane protein, partial [Eudoraea sp.]|nr:PorP/SprF family type IX secretion system membrane protein [Eudoraea sp.]